MSAFNGVAMVFAENKVALSMQIPLNIFFFFLASGIQWSRKSDIMILSRIEVIYVEPVRCSEHVLRVVTESNQNQCVN